MGVKVKGPFKSEHYCYMMGNFNVTVLEPRGMLRVPGSPGTIPPR